MVDSAERAGYKARLMSPFINTTGQCLEMFYWLTADNSMTTRENMTRIVVSTISEGLEEKTAAVIFGDTFDFVRFLLPLPDGVNRVAIEGIRDELDIPCGIYIDDIAVINCSVFGL